MSDEEAMFNEFKTGELLLQEKKYSEAADILSDALSSYVAKYGELGSECAEIYMKYGLALLREVEQTEENQGGNDIFGASVPKEIATGTVPEEEQDQEKGVSSKDAEGAGENKGAKDEDGGDEGEEEGDDEDEGEEDGEGDEEEGCEDGEEEGEEEEGAKNAENGETQGEGNAAAAEEPLQLAWEVLDVARRIFENDGRKPSLARQIMHSDTHSYLCDINLRNEMYDEALLDVQSCIDIREKICCTDDRLLLEAYHQMATVCLCRPQQDKQAEAITFYKKAAEVCEARIKSHRKLLAMEGEGEPIEGSSAKPQPKAKTESEINDIEAIMVDLLANVEAEETYCEMEASGAGSSSAGGASSSAFGGDALAALAAKAGFAPSGFATAPAGEPVRTLGVFGKSKKAKAAEAAAAASSSEAAGSSSVEAGSSSSVGEKRPAEEAADSSDGRKKAKSVGHVDGDASAAPTPAKAEDAAPPITAA